MKLLTMLVVVLSVTACSSRPPAAPEPTGKLTAINPAKIYISQLYTK